MKVEVTFVNFPASESIRALVASRIESRVAKFSDRFAVARAVFSADGCQHHVRVGISGCDARITVSAGASDIGHAVDQAIDKLGVALRKVTAKRKSRRVIDDRFASFGNHHFVEKYKGRRFECEDNAFDRFEDEFVRDFERNFESAV